MINLPHPPLFTGDSGIDIELLKTYINDLYSSLITNTASGYIVTGVTESRILTTGDTLTETQDFLGTLASDLITKGVISL